jgi:hypothetical protein
VRRSYRPTDPPGTQYGPWKSLDIAIRTLRGELIPESHRQAAATTLIAYLDGQRLYARNKQRAISKERAHFLAYGETKTAGGKP